MQKVLNTVLPSAPPAPHSPTALPEAFPVTDIENSNTTLSYVHVNNIPGPNNKKLIYACFGVISVSAALGLGLGFGLSNRNAKSMREPNSNSPFPPSAPNNDTATEAPIIPPTSTSAPTVPSSTNNSTASQNVLFMDPGKYNLCGTNSLIKNNGSLYYEHLGARTVAMLDDNINPVGFVSCHGIFDTNYNLISTISNQNELLKSFITVEDKIIQPIEEDNNDVIFYTPSQLMPVENRVETGFAGSGIPYYGALPGQEERSYNIIHHSICLGSDYFNFITADNPLNGISPESIHSVATLASPATIPSCGDLSKSVISSLILFKNSTNQTALRLIHSSDVIDEVIFENHDDANFLKVTVNQYGKHGLITSNKNIQIFELELIFETDLFSSLTGNISINSAADVSINNIEFTTAAVYALRDDFNAYYIHSGGNDIDTGAAVVVSIRQNSSELASAQFSQPTITPINIPNAKNYIVKEVKADDSKVVALLTLKEDPESNPIIIELDASSINYQDS